MCGIATDPSNSLQYHHGFRIRSFPVDTMLVIGYETEGQDRVVCNPKFGDGSSGGMRSAY